MSKQYTTTENSEQFERASYSSTRNAREEEFLRSPAIAALNELKKPHEEQDKEEEHKLVIEELDRRLPPRSMLFSSDYASLTNVLVLLFVALFVALLLWGRHIMTEGL